jgi:hypothetical protein
MSLIHQTSLQKQAFVSFIEQAFRKTNFYREDSNHNMVYPILKSLLISNDELFRFNALGHTDVLCIDFIFDDVVVITPFVKETPGRPQARRRLKKLLTSSATLTVGTHRI